MNVFSARWSLRDSWPLVLLLTAAALIVFNTPPLVGWDNSWYIVHGLNLLLDNGYTGADLNPILPTRGPLLPAFLALGMLLGVASSNAYLVVNIFAFSNVGLLYMLGHKFGNKSAGLFASLLYLCSGAASLGAQRIVDLIWTTFLMAALLVMPLGEKKYGPIQAVMTGLLLGLGYLTKETIILLYPLPFLAYCAIPTMRNRSGILYASAVTLTALIAPIFWVVYRIKDGLQAAVLGAQGGHVLGYLRNQLGIDSPGSLFTILWRTTEHLFIDPYALAFIPLAALIGLTFFSIRQPKWRVIALAAFCLTPLMVYIGLRGWPAGYLYPVYLLGYLAGGLLLDRWKDRFKTRRPWSHPAIMAMVILASGQLFLPSMPLSLFEQSKSRASFIYQTSIAATRTANQDILAQDLFPGLMEAVIEHNNRQAAVMAYNDNVGQWLYFQSQGNIRISFFPLIICHGSFRSQTRYTGGVRCDAVPDIFRLREKNGRLTAVVLTFFDLSLEKARKDGAYLFVSDGYIARRHLGPASWASLLEKGPNWYLWSIDSGRSNQAAPETTYIPSSSRKLLDKINAENPESMVSLVRDIDRCLDCFDKQRLNAWISNH